MFIAALFTVAKTWDQPQCPLTDKWIKKMFCIHTHTHTHTQTHTMEYYSAIKKNKILPFEATWMDLENIILCEVGQTNIIFYNLYMESKKYEKLVNIIKKQTHRYREQTSGYQWGERRVEG